MFLDKTRMVLRFALASMFVICMTAFASDSAYAQVIRELNTTLNVAATGNVDVVENLKISFPPVSQRTQFYRVVPIWYQSDKTHLLLDVHVKSVLMDDKVSVPFKSWFAGREFHIKVGDQTTILKGDHKFRIEYEIARGVHFVNGYPQLYLSVTGDQCPFPINNIIVNVNLPKGTNIARVKTSTLLQPTGERKNMPQMAGANALKVSVQNVKPSQSLIVVVDMPKGTVVPHSVLFDWMLKLQKFYQIFVLPAATIILLSVWWWFYGRDPGADKSAMANNWFPPDNVTPAEAGTLIDESCDLVDIVSTLIDLAARGYIKIRILPYSGFLYLDDKDYEFTMVKSASDPDLKPHEQLFLTALFGMSGTTYLSAVKGNFAEYLPSIKRLVYENLVAEKLFARDPEIDRKNFLAVGATIVTIGIGLLAASTYHIGGQATAAGTVLSGVIVLLAARTMPRRTSKGVAVNRQICKFESMVAHGNKKEMKSAASSNPDAFSRYLAYAVIFGHSERWASVFAEMIGEFPEWFTVDQSFLPEDFNTVRFVRLLKDSLKVIDRALTDRPYTAHTSNVNTLSPHSHHHHY